MANMIWKDNLLFKDFSQEELTLVQNFMREETFEKDAMILKEGEKGQEIYFIESGKVSILKNDYSHQKYQIDLLEVGEVFGEMTLIDSNLKRHASACALEPVHVQILSFSNLNQSHPELAKKISQNLNALLTSRLSTTNSAVVRSLRKELIQSKKRAAMSSLLIKTIAVLVAYQLVIQNAIDLFALQNIFTLIALFTIIVSWLCYKMIKNSGYPLKMYGITTRNWKKSIRESLLFSIPFFFAIVLLKYLYKLYSPEYADIPLFDPVFDISIHPNYTPPKALAIAEFILYILFSPAQEFIFRGTIQSSLQRFLTGKRRILSAIIVTNLLFVQGHFHFQFGFLTFIPGIFWSWLFLRHRTLIGVGLSHLLIGVWMFNIVGLRP